MISGWGVKTSQSKLISQETYGLNIVEGWTLLSKRKLIVLQEKDQMGDHLSFMFLFDQRGLSFLSA